LHDRWRAPRRRRRGGGGTFALTRTGTSEDASLTGDLDIASDLTIQGEGQAETEIDGNGTDRVLDILRTSWSG
jgi:hypothetical protein